MKRCPHCKHTLGFQTFLLRYGSDTLIKHSASAHPRAHICQYCHKKIWIQYRPALFKPLNFRYATSLFMISAVVTFLGARPILAMDMGQTFVFIILFWMFLMPLGIGYAKYQSMVLKEEK